MKDFGTKLGISPLRPAAYQLIPLLKLLENKLCTILIADEVGVGKTIASAYILSYLSASLRRPSLVACQPILVEKWLFELRSKFGLKAVPIRDTADLPAAISETRITKFRKLPPTYVMANSILLQRPSLEFKDLGVIVFDEIHTYRNPETISHNSAVDLSSRARFRVGLSATPINNSLEDLVTEFKVLMPDQEWDVLNAAISDVWNADRLSLTIPFVTRFTKEKLGIHFARRIIEEHRVSYPTSYYDFVRSAIRKHKKYMGKSGTFFDEVTYLRMAASSPVAFSTALNRKAPIEIDPKCDLARKLVFESPSSHILAFCEFEETANYLARSLASHETYVMTGSTPIFERLSIIDSFKHSKKAILVMTPVGSEGLDLQFSDTILNYDLHWNPMKLEQRIGRIDRIGQRKKSINIINFSVEGSIDEHIISVLKRKLELIAKSVFETSQILQPSKPSRKRLADEVSIEKEMNEYRQFVSALKWNSAIPEADYNVLPSVKLRYCSAAGIKEAGASNVRPKDFLKSTKEATNWLVFLEKEAVKIKDLIKFYQ